MSCRARFSISIYCGPSHSAGKRGGEKLKSVGVNSEFVGVVGRCGRRTRIESFICVFFSVGGTGAAGDGDSTGLLCFLLFFLAFGGLGLRFRSLDSIPFRCASGGWEDVLLVRY